MAAAWVQYAVVAGFRRFMGPDELNLGWTKEDDPGLVAENRRRFVGAGRGECLVRPGRRLVTVAQIHSATVQAGRDGDGAAEGGCRRRKGRPCCEGDGLMTDLPGVLLGDPDSGLRSGDGGGCEEEGWWGYFMRGGGGRWRGSSERGVAQMGEGMGRGVRIWIAAVGPSIGSAAIRWGRR